MNNTNSNAKTKHFNITLELNEVKIAKERIKKASFSQYVSNLIKEDNVKKDTMKSMKEIFGTAYDWEPFHDAKSEKAFYELIGLREYEIKSKK
jgi:hypothetical protein